MVESFDGCKWIFLSGREFCGKGIGKSGEILANICGTDEQKGSP